MGSSTERPNGCTHMLFPRPGQHVVAPSGPTPNALPTKAVFTAAYGGVFRQANSSQAVPPAARRY
eukprot:4225586-Pyramimonas_sp.AAC.1